MPYVETSAKTFTNVEQAFKTMVSESIQIALELPVQTSKVRSIQTTMIKEPEQ